MTDMSVAPVGSTPTAAPTATSGDTGDAATSQSQLLNVQDQVHLSPEGRALMERLAAQEAVIAESEGDGTDREKPKKTKEPHPGTE